MRNVQASLSAALQTEHKGPPARLVPITSVLVTHFMHDCGTPVCQGPLVENACPRASNVLNRGEKTHSYSSPVMSPLN